MLEESVWHLSPQRDSICRAVQDKISTRESHHEDRMQLVLRGSHDCYEQRTVRPSEFVQDIALLQGKVLAIARARYRQCPIFSDSILVEIGFERDRCVNEPVDRINLGESLWSREDNFSARRRFALMGQHFTEITRPSHPRGIFACPEGCFFCCRRCVCSKKGTARIYEPQHGGLLLTLLPFPIKPHLTSESYAAFVYTFSTSSSASMSSKIFMSESVSASERGMGAVAA